jgi:tetratricopeptide (TPR) repeat protein
LPLRGLALAYLDLDLPSVAQETFNRAQHVSNVNYGPHSLDQLPILNSKMAAYFDQQDAESALDVLDRIHLLYTRKYPKNSEELLPMYYQRAAIYDKLKMYRDSRYAWRHILAIKQRTHAKNDPALIEPHLRIAEIGIRGLQKDSFRAVTTSSAEKHLKRALWIAENNPEESWEVKKDCFLVLADFYTLFGMRGRASRYYSAAWELMSSDENYWAARARDFGNPVPLARVAPYPYARFEYSSDRDNIDPEEYLEGEMLVAFTINERGRTENRRVIDADPADFSLMERRVLNSVEDFIYRPRHVDGEPAATPDQQYHVKYFYLPADHQASIEKSSGRGRR